MCNNSKRFQHCLILQGFRLIQASTAARPNSPRVPVLNGSAIDTALSQKIEDLNKAISRLTLLHTHMTLTLRKNSMSVTTMLFTLHTSECSGNPPLDEFENCLRDGLTRILNDDMNDDQWLRYKPLCQPGMAEWV